MNWSSVWQSEADLAVQRATVVEVDLLDSVDVNGEPVAKGTDLATLGAFLFTLSGARRLNSKYRTCNKPIARPLPQYDLVAAFLERFRAGPHPESNCSCGPRFHRVKEPQVEVAVRLVCPDPLIGSPIPSFPCQYALA
jgi:hypothetical protein